MTTNADVYQRTVRDIKQDDWRIIGSLDTPLTGIQYDSRRVESGNLFVAICGEHSDGHAYISQAIENGAAAVVHSLTWDGISAAQARYPRVVWIGVSDPRTALAQCAAAFYANPSAALTVIGITGTNGKTTTSYIIKSILEAWGQKVGLIGTVRYLIGNQMLDAPHTTPEASDFQKLLRMMADNGCRYVVSEISSHALVQQRVLGTIFKVALFTNLTRDHLDYHKTMEDYFQAKRRLFVELLAEGGLAVINIDDQYGRRLAEQLRGDKSIENGCLRVLTYGVQSQDADIAAEQILAGFQSTKFQITTKDGSFPVESSLLGTTNVMNILAAAAVAIGEHIPIEVIQDGIRTAAAVPGRFEQVSVGQPFLALIDYAHTEDALERLLQNASTLLELSSSARPHRLKRCYEEQLFLTEDARRLGRVITVFGCGGNRDRGKRPKMGEIATQLSYFTILTSDNPRYEDPKQIIHEIEAGIRSDNYIVIHDRKAAIAMAVELASAGDIVVIAGKGHEDYQEIKGVKTHFSDREVLQEAIQRLLERQHRRKEKRGRSCRTSLC
jgi:UDP-N-acetylmuramoyl-L-alanyl-D-glutamate--2,6-diaminopimelate ligase